MDWERILACLWEGLASALLAIGIALAAVQAWPSKVQWLAIAGGAGVSFVNGVRGYSREPK